jgi:glycosyltransferase involved in cell wall biosynthesis
MKKITVFTPTYNRAYCLQRCYESLKGQTSNNFTWLIIDDGSTDHTYDLVLSWINEKHIEIKYFWQENQGMHAAHNTAYKHIDTELNVCIDSDDYMPKDAIEKIINYWEKYGNAEVSGIIGLDSDFQGGIIGSYLPNDIEKSTLFHLYNKYGVKGDKKLVYRTELTKNYQYPIFPDEKYVGLAYKYYKLDQHYEMLLMNEVLCCVEYLPDGSSKNMISQYIKNPRGFAFYRKELMKLPYCNIFFKFKQAIHYVASSCISKNKKFLIETPCKLLTILATPIGLTLYGYIVTKSKKVNMGS